MIKRIILALIGAALTMTGLQAATLVDEDNFQSVAYGVAPAIYNGQWWGTTSVVKYTGHLMAVELPLFRADTNITDTIVLSITSLNGSPPNATPKATLASVRFSASVIPVANLNNGISGLPITLTLINLPHKGLLVTAGEVIGIVLERFGGTNTVSQWVVWDENPNPLPNANDFASLDNGATWRPTSDCTGCSAGYRIFVDEAP
jgi:hypothetical protein